MDLKISQESIRAELRSAFDQVLDSGQYVLGRQLEQFESRFSEFCGTEHAVGVSNGSDALILSLKALGIGLGDEVIIPANTYVATALAVSHCGALPVFVEPHISTQNLNPLSIESAITDRTKAIIPVHLFGQICEMNRITQIADKHRLNVVEDNAQSHGSTFMGRPAGSWGILNATSFYPSKVLGALGDGGAITCNDLQLAEHLRSLRNYGSTVKNRTDLKGFNHRLDEMQAAFLNVKLNHLQSWIEARRTAATLYLSELKGVGDIILPEIHPSATHVYHLFVIRTAQRDMLKTHLESLGIQCAIHYPTPAYLQPAFSDLGIRKGAFPIAETLATTSLSIPLFPGMTEEQQNFVVESISRFYHD